MTWFPDDLSFLVDELPEKNLTAGALIQDNCGCSPITFMPRFIFGQIWCGLE